MVMPVSGPAAGTGVNRGAVHANFIATHQSEFDATAAKFGHAFEMETGDVGDVETFGYFEATPPAKIWPENEPRTYRTFKSNSFTVVTRRWQNGVEWKRTAKENDRTKSMTGVARQIGEEVSRIPRRVFFQMIRGSTDSDLLPVIGNAPDGAAIYSATDGAGAARFGVTGGNIASGAGVATSGAIVTDFFKCAGRFLRFLNSESRQIFSESVLEGGLIVYFNPANMEVFESAFKGRMIANVAQTAGISNLIQDSAYKAELRPSAEITDNDWFVFLKNPPQGKKPFVWTDARPMTAVEYGRDTGNQRAIDLDVEGIAADSRWGFGPALPWSTIKVDN